MSSSRLSGERPVYKRSSVYTLAINNLKMKLRKEVYDRIKKNEKLRVYFTKKHKNTKNTSKRNYR